MQISLRTILLNNTTLKISSLVIAFTGWSILHENSRVTLTTSAPVSLYHIPEGVTFKAPEKIQITLSGTPALIRQLDLNDLTLHLDGASLHEGLNHIPFSEAQLLLPPHVNLVHYSTVSIFVEKTVKKEETAA